MKQANFRFHPDLDFFLPGGRKNTWFAVSFQGNQSIKHLVESLGVPHTEIQQILANGKAVAFNYIVQNGDEINVYPVTTSQPGEIQDSLQEQVDGEPHFILDNHLGKLATYLRMLGFDAYYRNDLQDEELAEIASRESRILLSRDRRLLMRSMVNHGYCVRSLDPNDQIVEVVQRFNLLDQIKPFQRCLRCNQPLEPVRKETVLDRLEPLTRLYYEEFSLCPACDQVYWKGSHYQRMRLFLNNVLSINR